MEVPKSWNKVTLERFVHYTEYLNEKPEDLKGKIELLKKKTCAILGCTIEEAGKLDGKASTKFAKLLSKPLPSRLMLQFKHKGITYKPYIRVEDQRAPYKVIDKANDLRIDTQGFNGGKYSAFKNVAKRGHQEEGLNRNLHQLLYLVCEPVKLGFKKSFPFFGYVPYEPSIDEVKRSINDFKELPMEVANPLCVFFLRVSKELNNLLSDYSVEELKKMTKQMQDMSATLKSDTDGM